LDIIVFAAVAAALAMAIRGYAFGVSDHEEQLPMVYRAMDPSYLPKDFFVNASDGFGPRYYYVHLLAALGSVFPLAAMFLILEWLSLAGIALVTYVATRRLFDGSALAGMLAATMALSLEGCKIGLNCSIANPLFIPTVLAVPLSFLAVLAGLAGRPMVCGLLAGLASAIHPLLGAEAGGVALAAAAGRILWQAFRARGASAGTWRALAGVLAGLSILAVLSAALWFRHWTGAQARTDTKTFIGILVYFRLPHHYIASQFPVDDFVGLFAVLGAFALAFRLWKRDHPLGPSVLAPALAVGVVLVLFLCGFIFTEVIPTRLGTIMQPFRLQLLITWIVTMMMGAAIAAGIETDGAGHCVWGWIALAGSGLSEPLVQFFATLSEALRRWLSNRLPQHAGWLFTGVAVLVAVCLLLGFGGSRDEALAVTCLVATSWWLLYGPKSVLRPIVPVAATAGFVLLAGLEVPGASETPGTSVEKNPLARYRLRVGMEDSPTPDMPFAQAAAELTDPNAVFVVPPDWGRFRLTARRALVVDQKTLPYSDQAMLEWRKRITDCYGDVARMDKQGLMQMKMNFFEIKDAQLTRLAKTYGATHAVLYLGTPSALPVLCRNQAFKMVVLAKP
jgi:hypothetical protein